MKLRSLVESLGSKSWQQIAQFMPDRSACQCRDRYKNYLLDSLVTEPWTAEEDALIVHQFHQVGPKWVDIAKMLSGRSGNNVKNRWHKHLYKSETGHVPKVREESKAAAQLPPPTPAPPQPVERSELDWPHLFNAEENPVAVGGWWFSGFPLGDPLF
jgi:hypothetical protein